MWGTLSFNSVSSRARAAIGRLRGVFARRNVDDGTDAEGDMPFEAGSSLSRDEFEVQTVETEDSQKVSIFVSKPSEPAYFDELEEYTPTIVGTVKQDEAEETVAAPVKKERFVAAEPADLFINALRKPVRQRFDTSVPTIKKKAETPAAPAAAEVPVIEEVPQAVEVVPVVEKVTLDEAVVIPAVEEVVSISEAVQPDAVTITAVMEVPAEKVEESVDESFLELLESDEAAIECKIANSAVEEEAPVAVDAAVSIVVEEAEPIAAAPVAVPSMPKRFNIESLEPISAEAEIPADHVSELESAMTSVEAKELPKSSTPLVDKQLPEIITLSDEKDILLAFRPELDEDRREFVSTSYDDNYAFREDYLDETERTFKIRASSVVPKYKFDGNFRSLRY